MEHEQAASLLPDYADGVLDAGDADALERHLASCAECRETIGLLKRIAAEVAASGAAAFEDHPEAASLVDYSLKAARLAEADLAALTRHVGSCPTCAQEVASVRAAESWSRSWWRGVEEAFRAAIVPSPAPALATAFVALLLLYPAYLGVVRLPQVDRERDAAIEALASRGGPIATLALAAPNRGGEAPVPAIRLRENQAFLPIRVDFEISDWPAEQVVVVTLRETNSPRQLWRHSGSAAEMWDTADEAINLLLPAESLGAGAYILEIAREGSPSAAYSASFAIE